MTWPSHLFRSRAGLHLRPSRMIGNGWGAPYRRRRGAASGGIEQGCQFVLTRSKLLHVAPSDDHRRLERRIKELRTSLAKYETGALQFDPEAMADLTKAVRDIGDHLMKLSERIDRIEDNREEWTTRGWNPAPGGGSDAAV